MSVELKPNCNQALELGKYACEFMRSASPSESVQERTKLFHTDSVLCGISAVALCANAPVVLREEALEYPNPHGVPFFGSTVKVAPEKAIVANSSAVREWDSNGTNFGFRKELGFIAGEFGHNDFYPVAIAAAQMKGLDGAAALRGMMLSDSKGASAAISTEVAVLSMMRSMRGFIGPKDIFRNPESMFRQFEKTAGDSPFPLVLSTTGDDFAVMGMHFKLGLYEHQSAGALQGMIDLMRKHPEILENPGLIKGIKIVAYEPAFGIIGDPAKRDPKTRQSADHSMVYIVGTLLRKAVEKAAEMKTGKIAEGNDAMWKTLFLAPYDYDPAAIVNKTTRAFMEKMTFEHGGAEYDRNYPDGIPTSVVITTTDGRTLDSGFVMYPSGHARNTNANLKDILANKFERLGTLAMDDPKPLVAKLNAIEKLDAKQLAGVYDFRIVSRGKFE
jgi:2-methylcitrate dehydratase PrpD